MLAQFHDSTVSARPGARHNRPMQHLHHKYSEEVIRHRAVTGDGKPCEILERVTWERDGEQRVEINRRYDLRTGERLNRLTETDFEDDVSGDRIQLLA